LDANTERLFTNNGILATNANADTLAFFLPQPIVEGHVLNFADVENLEDRNSLSVVADISSRSTNLVTNLRLEPNPFTPNGDRINDALAISYDVQRLLIAKQIEVSIYDLGGRRVKVFNQNVASGGYTQVWDGRDTAGNLVSPGMYILQISTQADESGEDVIKLISVVY
jgi:flagellar hook assembly protein FlgD